MDVTFFSTVLYEARISIIGIQTPFCRIGIAFTYTHARARARSRTRTHLPADEDCIPEDVSDDVGVIDTLAEEAAGVSVETADALPAIKCFYRNH